MSRASRRDNSTAPSLFPFLAVLLCTMGVLVVLLVVMASIQLSQAESKQQAEVANLQIAYNSPEQQELRAELAAIEERKQKLQLIEVEATKRLRNEEQRLSQVEENIRRRQERLALLRVEIEEMQALDGEGTDDLKQARAELQRLTSLIATTKLEIEDLVKDSKRREKHFAIVPYDGDKGTHRKPIYIECRRESVIFQPENIILTAADFNEEMRAGGPLPSGVRAAQRYYVDHGLIDKEKPYPLVIARPDASGSLTRVLNALSVTKMEFGYEIVEADWTFDFNGADPALSEEIRREIANARERLASLRGSAPDRFAAKPVETFDFGPSLLESVRRGSLPPNYVPVGVLPESRSESAVLSGQAIDMGRLAEVLRTGGNRGGSSGILSSGRAGEQLNEAGGRAAFERAERIAKTSTENTGGHTASGESIVSSAEASVPGDARHSDLNAEAFAQKADAPRTSTSGSTPGEKQNGSNGIAVSSIDGHSSSSSGGGMARRNGKELPGMSLVRTIRVRIASDQLVVKSSKGDKSSQAVIRLDRDLNQAAQAFVKSIQDEVKGWGIAGQGLHWQPVLHLSVVPGSEVLAQRLAAVIRQSGVEVRLAMLP